MTLIASILAATLSLASTNDYKFAVPQSTNLIGKTYIPEGGVIPRYEDIAFLREAYAERNEAIGAYWSPVTVPDSFALAAGSFGGLFLPEEWFAPSFGHWDGFSRYQTGFFLRPGISVRPLFQETGPDYLWDGELDTAWTNTIRAFVDPRTAAWSTNGLLAATLEGAPRTNVMQLAYAMLTNDVWILSRNPIEPGNWSLAERHVDVSTSSYKSSPDGEWHTSTYTSTNTAPYNPVWWRNTRSRDVTRHYTDDTYTDYESYSGSYLSMDFSGNLSAMNRVLDARLTNAIETVRCIVVARFRANLMEEFNDYTVGQDWSTNRYFVIVQDGVAVRHPTHPFEGGSSVWDTGCDILPNLREVYFGTGLNNWCNSVSAPEFSGDAPKTGLIDIFATHKRVVDIYPDGIYAYFYVHKNWNAKLEDNDQ